MAAGASHGHATVASADFIPPQLTSMQTRVPPWRCGSCGSCAHALTKVPLRGSCCHVCPTVPPLHGVSGIGVTNRDKLVAGSQPRSTHCHATRRHDQLPPPPASLGVKITSWSGSIALQAIANSVWVAAAGVGGSGSLLQKLAAPPAIEDAEQLSGASHAAVQL